MHGCSVSSKLEEVVSLEIFLVDLLTLASSQSLWKLITVKVSLCPRPSRTGVWDKGYC